MSGEQLQVRRQWAGRRVLLTGATGFVGKVWLAFALDKLPEIERFYLLLRDHDGADAVRRAEEMFGQSPAFRALRQRLGAKYPAFIRSRVEVVPGDLLLPGLGLDPARLVRLSRQVDLIINSAGLVDFNPDVRQSLASNVDGALHVAALARLAEVPLLHVSTTYVAGTRNGRIPEKLEPARAPNGGSLDAEAEVAELRRLISEREGTSFDSERAATKAFIQLGKERAEQHGFVNIYTYTKSLAERLLALRALPSERICLFRPSIIESALEYPFPGWIEGFKSSGPLVYLAGTWCRDFPARPGPLDLVPVDEVCRSLCTVGAALLAGERLPVVQCGTSARNPLDAERTVELGALSHRLHLRANGTSWVERSVLSRWDAVPRGPDSLLAPWRLRAGARWLLTTIGERPGRLGELADKLRHTEFLLRAVERAVEAYRPFLHDQKYLFISDELARLAPDDDQFAFRPERIDWRDYFLNVHVPGLRKFVFPDRDPEEARDPIEYPVQLLSPQWPTPEAEDVRMAS